MDLTENTLPEVAASDAGTNRHALVRNEDGYVANVIVGYMTMSRHTTYALPDDSPVLPGWYRDPTTGEFYDPYAIPPEPDQEVVAG